MLRTNVLIMATANTIFTLVIFVYIFCFENAEARTRSSVKQSWIMLAELRDFYCDTEKEETLTTTQKDFIDKLLKRINEERKLFKLQEEVILEDKLDWKNHFENMNLAKGKTNFSMHDFHVEGMLPIYLADNRSSLLSEMDAIFGNEKTSFLRENGTFDSRNNYGRYALLLWKGLKSMDCRKCEPRLSGEPPIVMGCAFSPPPNSRGEMLDEILWNEHVRVPKPSALLAAPSTTMSTIIPTTTNLSSTIIIKRITTIIPITSLPPPLAAMSTMTTTTTTTSKTPTTTTANTTKGTTSTRTSNITTAAAAMTTTTTTITTTTNTTKGTTSIPILNTTTIATTTTTTTANTTKGTTSTPTSNTTTTTTTTTTATTTTTTTTTKGTTSKSTSNTTTTAVTTTTTTMSITTTKPAANTTTTAKILTTKLTTLSQLPPPATTTPSTTSSTTSTMPTTQHDEEDSDSPEGDKLNGCCAKNFTLWFSMKFGFVKS